MNVIIFLATEIKCCCCYLSLALCMPLIKIGTNTGVVHLSVSSPYSQITVSNPPALTFTQVCAQDRSIMELSQALSYFLFRSNYWSAHCMGITSVNPYSQHASCGNVFFK